MKPGAYGHKCVNLICNPCVASYKWALENSVDPDQTALNDASHQGLHCRLTVISIQNIIKVKKQHQTADTP